MVKQKRPIEVVDDSRLIQIGIDSIIKSVEDMTNDIEELFGGVFQPRQFPEYHAAIVGLRAYKEALDKATEKYHS